MNQDPEGRNYYASGGRIGKLIALFEEQHEEISHLFYTGSWSMIQYRESTIARSVMKCFVDSGLACLPIHDSFVVKERYKSELRVAMEESFKTETGGFRCPISEA